MFESFRTMWTDLCLKASAQWGLTMYRLVNSSKKLSNTAICEKHVERYEENIHL